MDSLVSFTPDGLQPILENWDDDNARAQKMLHWPTDAMSEVHPVACHSHNDYWRKVPLFSAIQVGCSSVEADIWLFNDDLFVGRTIPSLTETRTLRRLYLDPLMKLLDEQNTKLTARDPDHAQMAGVFDTDPSQSLTLMLDFNSGSDALLPVLQSQLQPLRTKDYITYYNGSQLIQRPLTIVASGMASLDGLAANEAYREVFFDAPLGRLADSSSEWENPNRVTEMRRNENNRFAFSRQVAGLRSVTVEATATGFDDDAVAARTSVPTATEAREEISPPAPRYNWTNSYFASMPFTDAVGYVWGSRLSQKQLQIIRAQIRGAHAQGLRVRYSGVPYWPMGMRNHIWHILVREGVDSVSVDDLKGAVWGDWRRTPGWW